MHVDGILDEHGTKDTRKGRHPEPTSQVLLTQQ
jgi:hypothetical protein